jgi:hypothetical protein
MDGWTDGWMDGWMDGRMDGWTDGWTDGRTDKVSYRGCLLAPKNPYKICEILRTKTVSVIIENRKAIIIRVLAGGYFPRKSSLQI